MDSNDHFITDAQSLIAAIERDPAKLRAYNGDFERLIARCMDEQYLLAVKDGCRQRRADIEFRARLVEKGFRRECAN